MTFTRTKFLYLVLFILLLASTACSDPTPPVPTITPHSVGGAPRAYHLGFTTFPYDISREAVDYTYDRLISDADLIAIHMDNGIPWKEALADEAFNKHIMEQWEQDRAHIPPGHAVYVAITPINSDRNTLATYRAKEDDMPLPAPWDGYAFNAPEVKQAYLNYVLRVIDYFQPDYLTVGIEVNLLMKNSPEKWAAYLELQQATYTEVKLQHPDLPVMVSMTAPELLDDFTDSDYAAQMQVLQDVLPYSDYFALSLYPFMGAYLTDYPDSMWDDLFALNPGKPIAIAETGFPAETLELPSFNLRFAADADKQAAFVADLLTQADEQDMVFIVNFILRDYDALWKKIGSIEVFSIWRDTGLYDENGNPRPALTSWNTTLSRPYRR